MAYQAYNGCAMVDVDKLDEEQKDAVTTTEGHVRVIAGAGSDKTRALSMRYAYPVECIGVIPYVCHSPTKPHLK